MTDLPTLPVTLRVHLAHATLQAIADSSGADVLHIKGPALDPSLRAPVSDDDAVPPESPGRPGRRSSVDADILVRPSHMQRYMAALRVHGWQQVTPYLDSGLVQHSTDWYHPELGATDLHGRFPGIQIRPEDAFDRLWRQHGEVCVAHRRCAVPSVDAQRLILLLHAARDPGRRSEDVRRAWGEVSDGERAAIRVLAAELKAEVGLAAAIGELETFRDRPEYALWRLYADGESASAGFAKLVALSKSAPAGYEHVWRRLVLHGIRTIAMAPQRLAAQAPHALSVSASVRSYVAQLRRVCRFREKPRN